MPSSSASSSSPSACRTAGSQVRLSSPSSSCAARRLTSSHSSRRLRHQSCSRSRSSSRPLDARLRHEAVAPRPLVVAHRRASSLLQTSTSSPCTLLTFAHPRPQPILGPLVGSIAGALAYDLCIFTGPGRCVALAPPLRLPLFGARLIRFSLARSPVNFTGHEVADAMGLYSVHNMVWIALSPEKRRERRFADNPRSQDDLAENGLATTLARRDSARILPGRSTQQDKSELRLENRFKRAQANVLRQCVPLSLPSLAHPPCTPRLTLHSLQGGAQSATRARRQGQLPAQPGPGSSAVEAERRGGSWRARAGGRACAGRPAGHEGLGEA